MSPNNQLIYEYCNHISQYADGRFSIQQVEDDINFKNILNSIISNNYFREMAFDKIEEFKIAYEHHYDNNH